jgi:hypothetical protein
VRSESSLFGRVRPLQGIRIFRNASVMEKLTLSTHKEEVKALDKKKGDRDAQHSQWDELAMHEFVLQLNVAWRLEVSVVPVQPRKVWNNVGKSYCSKTGSRAHLVKDCTVQKRNALASLFDTRHLRDGESAQRGRALWLPQNQSRRWQGAAVAPSASRHHLSISLSYAQRGLRGTYVRT